MIDSKRIAKNTVFLYFRMILIMGVTLYSSRVVLDKLGVDDYAIYNVVFSLIGMLSFLNGTLSIGTSRFITFELGKNDPYRLKKTFSTALVSHILLAGIIFVLGETVGLWYVNNVLIIDEARRQAAGIVYQISIFSTCVSILQVPYTSCIIAHERMNIYAYIGIFEAVGKLAIVFVLNLATFDKLILYALMVFGIHIIIIAVYIVFCQRLFDETRKLYKLDKRIFSSIIKFSGWNIVANISNTLLSEGVILLFNLFFQPFVVAAQGVAKQISQALMAFINNVRVAVNPQITKLYAEDNFDESKRLALKSAELIFYMLLLLGVPCILAMPTLLDIWLVDVPEYAVEFARLIVLQNILDNFNAAFYTPMTAANEIKKNSLASVFICFTQFGTLYILFNLGFGPLWARYIGLLSCVIFSFIVKPYILYKDIGYTIQELYSCILQCMKVGFLVAVFSIMLYLTISQVSIWNTILVIILSCLGTCLIIYFCMSNSNKSFVRQTIGGFVKGKIKYRR